jgi:hypothetical protein
MSSPPVSLGSIYPDLRVPKGRNRRDRLAAVRYTLGTTGARGHGHEQRRLAGTSASLAAPRHR